VITAALVLQVIDQSAPLPHGPLAFGTFTAQFRDDGNTVFRASTRDVFWPI
jgi:hypothetical protein